MNVPTREVTEATGLAALTAAAWCGTGHLWPALLTAGAALVYLSHGWEFTGIKVVWKRGNKRVSQTTK